jgi:hypothetical protein
LHANVHADMYRKCRSVVIFSTKNQVAKIGISSVQYSVSEDSQVQNSQSAGIFKITYSVGKDVPGQK